jgi:outer membrane protein TolC
VQEADARADAALAQYRKTVLTAVLDVREAYSSLDLQWQVQQAEQQRVASLERARFLAQLGVGVGALNQIDLLDAERNAFDARLAEVTAYRDRLIGQVAAFKALGGGHAGAATSADVAQATAPTTPSTR